ncbi:MAG TPA: gephyrin-like molybdotransferase Glp [Candidatus Saccharimonadales bacterium]|nr:gephyrin-like molybdotransferase Glp [Candidatus Saccharimonadales bacterium]
MVRAGIFKKLTDVDDALAVILGSVDARIRIKHASLAESVGCVLGEDVVAHLNLPSEDRSVVDGFAVIARDTDKATIDAPVNLKHIGESVLGNRCHIRMKPGETVSVATGSAMPLGADSVIPIEDCIFTSAHVIQIGNRVRIGQNVVRKGADVSPRRLVLQKGRRLRPEDVGVLKALGIRRVKVRVLLVGTMSTGNELTDCYGDPSGKIVDINRIVLGSMVTELGAVPVDLGIVPDREAALLKMLRKAIRRCDVVLVSGGSSVGKRDLVPKCIHKLGKPGMLVHGVAMRPSMPTGFGIIRRKPIMSLPGVPVSAVFAFRVFGRPLIAKLMGASEPTDPIVEAELTEKIRGVPGYRTLVRVVVRPTKAGLVAQPLKTQASSVFTSIVTANGYVTLSPDASEVLAGAIVKVTLIGEISSNA